MPPAPESKWGGTMPPLRRAQAPESEQELQLELQLELEQELLESNRPLELEPERDRSLKSELELESQPVSEREPDLRLGRLSAAGPGIEWRTSLSAPVPPVLLVGQ